MSTITAPTRMLVGLLQDLLLTAYASAESRPIHGVLLHTEHGEFELDIAGESHDEPVLIESVPSDLLVGTSTDRRAIAQAHLPCEGQWLRGAFVPLPDAKAVIAAFKPLINSLGKEITHISELELTAGTLTVREFPILVPNGLSVWFPVSEGDDFPRALVGRLTQDPMMPVAGKDHEVIEPSYGHGWTPAYLSAMGAIGKRRKMPVAVYRHHQHRPAVVEIGASYRAAISPVGLAEDDGQHEEPQVPVFNLPEREVPSFAAVGE